MKKKMVDSFLPFMEKMMDVIAHDVRNPLNNILLSTAQFKLDALPDKDDTDFYIEIIENNCFRINQLLTEIISAFHAPALHVEEWDFTELLQELEVEYQTEWKEKKINCTYQLLKPLVATFDRSKMKSAFIHLVQNAIDALPNGGTLHVETQKLPNGVSISFTDSGSGILNEDLDRLYTPFFTTRERKRGLGLTYVKQIIDAHVGHIQITSTAGQGTRVLVVLPQ